jgi:hypothetical protein
MTRQEIYEGNVIQEIQRIRKEIQKLQIEISQQQDKKTGIKYLPNVKDFKITRLQPIDGNLQEETGITRRLGEAEIQTSPYHNEGINRYIRRQTNHLHKLQGNHLF